MGYELMLVAVDFQPSVPIQRRLTGPFNATLGTRVPACESNLIGREADKV